MSGVPLGDQAFELAGHFQEVGNIADLDAAIELWSEAAATVGLESAKRLEYLDHLGSAHRMRFEVTHRDDDLMRSLEVLDDAVSEASTPTHDLGWRVADNLGTTQAYLYLHTGDPRWLEEAIVTHANAVAESATSDDPIGRSQVLNNLARDRKLRYDIEGKLADLDGAIECWQNVVASLPEDHPHVGMIASSFADALRARYAALDDAEDIARAVVLRHIALEKLLPGANPVAVLEALALDLLADSQASGNKVLVEKAIQTWEAAIGWARDAGSPSLPSLLNNLAVALMERYRHTGQLDDLADAIDTLERAVEAVRAVGGDEAAHREMLARALDARHARTGNDGDRTRAAWLREVTDDEDEVVETSIDDANASSTDLPTVISEHAARLRDLIILAEGTATWSAVRALCYRHPELLDDRVDAILVDWSNEERARGEWRGRRNRAVAETAVGRPGRRGVDAAIGEFAGGEPIAPLEVTDLVERAVGAWKRFQGGEHTALDEVCAAWDELFRQPGWTDASSAFRRHAATTAASARQEVHRRSGEIDDLVHAVQWWERAIAEGEPGTAELASDLNHLGAASRALYAESDDPQTLERAIDGYRRAVAEVPEGSPDLPNFISSLGLGLLDRANRSGDPDELDEAIEALGRAADLSPADAEFAGWHAANLAAALRTQMNMTPDRSDLERCIAAERRAVAGLEPGAGRSENLRHLAWHLFLRWQSSPHGDDITEVVTLLRAAHVDEPGR